MLLEQTHLKNIVEDSKKDDFWGAIRYGEEFRGVNALGRLLMELRSRYYNYRYSSDMFIVHSLNIVDFKLLEQPIQIIDARNSFLESIKKSLNLNDINSNNLLFGNNMDKDESDEKQLKKKSDAKKKKKKDDSGMLKLPF